ncbi:MAG: hypothetical protein LBD29_10490 [Treponema sp.]|jgi:hypothetical protein|nr:hypothetical protein [Treponema sp.]
MQVKYILSSVVGIIVFFSGASCTTNPKEAEIPNMSRADSSTLFFMEPVKAEGNSRSETVRGEVPEYENLPEEFPVHNAGFNASFQQDSSIAEKRRQAEQAITDTILLLGAGPLLIDMNSLNSFYFIPIATLAHTGFSDTPARFIDNLRNNKYFRESARLAQEAQNAFNQEDYDLCIQYAEEAQKYARLSDEYVTQQLEINEADMEIAIAYTKLTWALSIDASRRYPAEYKQAQIAYAEARSARAEKDWKGAVAAAQSVLSYLADLQETDPVIADLEQEPAPVSIAEAETPQGSAGSPEAAKPLPQASGGKEQAPRQVQPAAPQQSSSQAPASRTAKTAEPSKVPAAPAKVAKTPQTPELAPKNIDRSPGVPGLAGATREPPSTARHPSSRIAESPKTSVSSTASASRASISALAMGNTPPVPALDPAVVNTPGVPALVQDGPVLAKVSPKEIGGEIPVSASASKETFASALPVYESSPQPQPTNPIFVAQYKVHSWNTSMDCFWNIAGRPWVYGDSSKWVVLYYANISKLPDPQNPNLLPPDMLLDIPPIAGEPRDGIGRWNGRN